MSIVVDASVLLAAAVDASDAGEWARQTLDEADQLVAPHLLPVEVTHRLRKLVIQGLVSDQAASLQLAQLTKLPIDYYPFVPLVARVWELRNNVAAYDAWYVALAEALKLPLATLDMRLTRATGPACKFVTQV